MMTDNLKVNIAKVDKNISDGKLLLLDNFVFCTLGAALMKITKNPEAEDKLIEQCCRILEYMMETLPRIQRNN